jgi:hypothetical protein
LLLRRSSFLQATSTARSLDRLDLSANRIVFRAVIEIKFPPKLILSWNAVHLHKGSERKRYSADNLVSGKDQKIDCRVNAHNYLTYKSLEASAGVVFKVAEKPYSQVLY